MTRIRDLRVERQADADDASEWTQAGTAAKVGAGLRAYKSWESGEHVPRRFFQRRLAKVFGVTVDELGLPAADD